MDAKIYWLKVKEPQSWSIRGGTYLTGRGFPQFSQFISQLDLHKHMSRLLFFLAYKFVTLLLEKVEKEEIFLFLIWPNCK